MFAVNGFTTAAGFAGTPNGLLPSSIPVVAGVDANGAVCVVDEVLLVGAAVVGFGNVTAAACGAT